MTSKAVCLVAVLLGLVGGSLQSEQLKVAVYYDGIEDSSKSMFVNSILPGYFKHMDDVEFEFDLIPYGESGDPSRVLANKVQACIFNEDRSAYNKMEFVKCALRQKNPSDMFYVKVCINYWGFNFAQVRDCYEGEKGDELLVRNKERTADIVPALAPNTPVVIFDDNFDNEVSQHAGKYFFDAVCAHFEYKLTGCPH